MGGTRTADIVKGLQNFTRMDTGQKVISNIHQGLDDTLTILISELRHNVKVVKNYVKDVNDISCYPGQLNQVFLNILANAVQAIENEGHITITTNADKDKFTISIQDDGIGMSDEVQKHIFEPFYTTKELGSGIGLGLSISYGIIENHNGSIRVKSEVGKGSEFLIELPLM